MSQARQPQIAIVGPGAIGSTIAACLHEAGHPLTLCGRTPRDQLVVTTDSGATTTVPGPVLTDPAARAATAPLVFLAVKATQIEASAPWLARLCGPDTVLCVLQNGVEQVELVAPHARGARVVPSVIWCPAETDERGVVRLRGEPRISVPADSGGRAVAAALDGSSCVVELSSDFVTISWRKLCQNAVSGLMVLAGRRAGMFRRADVAALATAYIDECATVGRAEGAVLAADVAQEILAWLQGVPEDLGSSILFDHEAGRPLEWDARNGVVVRRGARHGIPTPISDVVVPLLAAASE
ncbi:MAG: oxidoreductase [Gaiellales bacterium]